MIAKVGIRKDHGVAATAWDDDGWVVTVWHHKADHVLDPGRCRCRWASNDHRFRSFTDALSYLRGLEDRMKTDG